MHSLSLDGQLKNHEIKDAFKKYGSNLRTIGIVLVYKTDKDVVERLRQNINVLSLSAIHEMLSTDSKISEQTPHSLVTTVCFPQPHPGEDGYDDCDYVNRSISCPVVWDALFNRHGKSLYGDVRLMNSLFQRIPEASSTAGWLWEGHCHSRISRGGSFTLVRMIVEGTNLVPRRTKPELMKIRPLTPRLYRDEESVVLTRNLDEYYIPFAKNNPTFDAFFLSKPNQIALQMTTSSSHSLEHDGFKVLNKRRPKNTKYKQRFIFVVPKSKAGDFKCKVPDCSVLKGYQFFLLELDPDYRGYCLSPAYIWKLSSLGTPLVVNPYCNVDTVSGDEVMEVEERDDELPVRRGSKWPTPGVITY